MVWESSWNEGATSSSSSFHFHFSLVVNTAFLLLVHVQKETLCRELLSPPLTASQKRICIVTSVFPVYCTCRIFEIIFHMYVWFFEINNNTFSNPDKYKLSEFGLIFLFKKKKKKILVVFGQFYARISRWPQKSIWQKDKFRFDFSSDQFVTPQDSKVHFGIIQLSGNRYRGWLHPISMDMAAIVIFTWDISGGVGMIWNSNRYFWRTEFPEWIIIEVNIRNSFKLEMVSPIVNQPRDISSSSSNNQSVIFVTLWADSCRKLTEKSQNTIFIITIIKRIPMILSLEDLAINIISFFKNCFSKSSYMRYDVERNWFGLIMA